MRSLYVSDSRLSENGTESKIVSDMQPPSLFLQPEQAQFEFDFSRYDQRVAVNILLMLTAKEGWGNIKVISYTDADGNSNEEVLRMGVPRTWTRLQDIPTSGFFAATYDCQADERDVKMRAELLFAYGFQELAVAGSDDVDWCSGWWEIPPDAMELLRFLNRKFPDAAAAFQCLDEADGNGTLSLQEFVQGVTKKLECTIEKQRIEGIYRFLDSSGDGKGISRKEWLRLDVMWHQFRRSASDFALFLAVFAGHSFANRVWHEIGADESTQMKEERWCEALRYVGYLGPSLEIFAFLDKENVGTVSINQFQELEGLVH